ncbi:MAG: MBL fold metallo-hydrolase [Thermoanaerobaculia bacterium]|jgi:beta-lactamase superfamily II metal-dependent hydrolase
MRLFRLSAVVLFLLLGATSAFADSPSPTLPPWTRGHLDIHQISTGRGNAAFIVFPDGTTLLVDAGDAGEGIPLATAMPDASRGAGEWIARYLKRVAGDDVRIDFAVATHFHPDHIGNPQPTARKSAEGGFAVVGLAAVNEQVPIRKLVDRGFPDYGEPATPVGDVIDNYRKFADYTARSRGIIREKIRVGRSDQLVSVRDAAAFPGLEVRAVAGNGIVWTGKGNDVVDRFPPQKELPKGDRAPENSCSIALRIRYGKFSFYTGGDLYGQPEPGAPAWWDMETPIAKAIGKTDVMVVNHHGSIEPANPFSLGTLQPRVIVVPAWSPTHPSPDVLKRLLSTRIWSAPRDVFITQFRDATKAAIGPRATKVASDAGHIVIRVEPGGKTYRVYVVDNKDESGTVKSIFGPYTSGVR